jgi:hypothetical protein
MPITKPRPTRTSATRTRPTARTADPLADVRELAECYSAAWARELWGRLRPRADRLLALAKRIDLAAEAASIARSAEGNPVLEAKEARVIRRWLYSVCGSIMTAYEAPGPSRAGKRPATGPKRRARPKTRRRAS